MIRVVAKIRVLNELLINKIAAGEVVERPASALKELLENSLDAGAKELLVDLEAGGKRLIRVADDGEGMSEDDLLLALERHATSKIKEIEDLEEVGSLGFRGEALPAIAAVSRLTLRSRRRDADEGREVTVAGGEIKDMKPAAVAPGTVVEVRSLFFNVPARRKFLRTPETEFGHCQNVVNQYALAFPECTVRLRHNGIEQINAAPTESMRDRIAQLLGTNLLRSLIATEGREGDVGVVGFVSEPSLHRPNTSMLHFFVNRRAVRDKVLMAAVRTAYEDLLPKRRAPVAFLFIELPPRAVDVNVHPSKIEIRFRNPGMIHDLVVRTVRRALSADKPLSPLAPSTAKTGGAAPSAALESLDKALKRGRDPGPLQIDFRELRDLVPGGERPGRTGTTAPAGQASVPEGTPRPSPEADVEEIPVQPEPERFRAREIDPLSVVPLGQLKNSYIIATFAGGLMIVDQHAAHERILYEKFQKGVPGSAESQRLLHPVVIDLPPAQARAVEAYGEALAELGFEVEPFGPGSVVIRSLPAALETKDAEEILSNMASDLEKTGKADPEILKRELIISASCHGAIKINTPLDHEKIRRLLDDLLSCEMPMRCPHGRPVILTFGHDDLKRRFGRS